MAIYHIRLGRVKRREGRSTVAAAAFQADEKLLASATGIIHHPPPRPDLIDKRIVAPSDVAADWLADRETLWNRAEAADKRANACVAYLIDFALPIELSDEQNIDLGADFAQGIADYTKAVCDLALRWMSPENIAGVILLSSREVGLEGFGEKMRLSMTTPRRKSLGYTPHPISDLTDIREMLARVTNAHLERAGINARVDHRSLKDRGIDLIPQTHLGPVASRRIKNGEAMDHAASSTERSVHNAIQFFQNLI